MSGGILGMDLDDWSAQISFWLPGAQTPETISTGDGEEDRIPAVLCRRTDRDVWTYGKEALETARRGGGVLADRLLSRALAGEQLEIGGEWFEAAALLALFIKRSLSLLGGAMRPEKADFFMFTLERVDRQALEMVERIALLLSLPPERVSCQSRAESFFFYNISQPEELWRHSCLICDFGGERLKTLLLEVNRHTRPATVTVAQEEHPELERQDNREEMDEAFLSIFRSVSDGRIIDTVYLIGDGFAGEWYPKTLAVMCRNRRVFQGNNLYSKGACYGGKAKRPGGGVSGREYVYLGSDMLRVNVGLLTEKRGKETCLSLLDAGMNWFDARGECEFLLDADHTFTLRLTPVSGKKLREVVVTLSGVPERPPFATRIFLAASCPDAETVRLRMEDRGFGEFFPSSGLAWEESLPLTEVLAE
ncbi:MAG TPA: hypothetical protein H9831_05405 [Candidatus Eisenbergiella pullistercoris]|uniref:DUF5716 domain-containing protein n=1 Tax=Candidatus Eisenbergiella pullistercoris TaxID=2838555 RepID=A0A9D1YNP9_9FIRM|nr:hypothetical protein [Candidatus Eisenbergiella pullistercoris]